nr:hypothetical protein [Tanacetum cinerariifolium]
GYVDESDPEEDPEEYDEDGTDDGPVGYPMDGGDDGDDDDIDSSGCMALSALPSPPLPPSSYPPPPIDRRDGIPESEQPPRKRLCLSTLGSSYEVGESSTRGQGDSHIKAGCHGFTASRFTYGDKMTLQETVWIMEKEAYTAREVWAHSVGLSQTVHHELQTLREQVYAQEYQLQTQQA